MVVGIVCCVKEDGESAQRWFDLLGGSAKARKIDLNELATLTTEAFQAEFEALLVCGVEAYDVSGTKQTADEELEHAAARLVGDRTNLTEQEIEAIALELALKSLGSDSRDDIAAESSEFEIHKQSLRQLIRELSLSDQTRIVGLGAGSITVCEALGGRSEIASHNVMLRIEPAITTPNDDVKASVSLPRVCLSQITGIPIRTRTFLTSSDSHEILGFTGFVDEADPKLLCLNGNPELLPDSLIEFWLPKLDELLVLSSDEATRLLHRCQSDSPIDTDPALDLILRHLLSDKLDAKDRRILFLERKVERLERELAILRAQTEAPSYPSGHREQEEDVTEEERSLRALLAGVASGEDVVMAETGLIDLEAQKTNFDRPMEMAPSCPSAVLSLVVPLEDPSDIIFGCTDKTLRASKSEDCVVVDAAPIVLAVRPMQIPTRVACGMLSGSIELFDCEKEKYFGRRFKLEDSPHTKHICGLVFDPLGSGVLASISKDGILAFWSGEKQPKLLSKLGFHADRPPECCVGVVVRGRSYVAIGKRNDNIVSLVPFDEPSKQEAHLKLPLDDSLELGATPGFTSLAMATYKHVPVLAIAFDKSTVSLYDLLKMRKIRDFHGHVCDEYARPSLAFDQSKGTLLAVTSNPNKVFVFRVNRPLAAPVILEDHRAVVRCVVFTEVTGMSQLVTGSFDKRVLRRRLLRKDEVAVESNDDNMSDMTN